jgi:peptide methionine sulfoxide reductase MsrB
MAANPDSAFTAGWIATFARVNDLGLNHTGASDFLGGLVGFLDSVAKAGLGAEAANAVVKRGSDNSVIVEIKIANGVEVPGALSVFADQLKITSDASGQTLQFTVDSGLSASGTLLLGAAYSGGGGHDIMVGGAGDDIIAGGAGFDFIDGGAGNDTLYGQDGNDILRAGPGNDYLLGGAGNDIYVFNRGDGADILLDDYTVTTTTTTWKTWTETRDDGTNIIQSGYVTETTTDHRDAGTDSLVFGPGIAVSDIAVQLVSAADGVNQNLIVRVKDPADPGMSSFNNIITLQHWNDAFDRIERFAFADGSSLNVGAALATYQVPFGASLSHSSVVERSAIGTVVGTVTGFDFNANAGLSYSMVDGAGGRFAVNASTGVLSVAGAINYDETHSLQVTVRATDQSGNGVNQTFSIGVIDIPNRAPVLSVPVGAIKANPGEAVQMSSLFSATDADGDALTYVFQDGTTTANSGYFMLNGAALAQGATFGVTAAQLGGVSFVASAAGVDDVVTMLLSDGHALSAVGTFHVNINHAPVLSVQASSITTNPDHALQVSSWFSASDADGDALTYVFQDGTTAANSGYFMLNGAALAQGATFSVSAAQLAGLSFVSSAAGVNDVATMLLNDGHALSAVGTFYVNVGPNHAPVLSVPAGTITTNPSQSLQMSRLFSATDSDNDALTYFFQDGTTAANSGHFVLNGTAYAQGATFGVTAAQLAGLTFVAGAAGVADDFSMQLSDGHAVSAVGTFHVQAKTPTPTDFNGDAKSDLLLLNDLTHGLYVCEMNGAVMGENALSFTIAAGAGWHFQGLGDFDGDRKSDVLLLNYTSAGVYVCEMNGTQLGTNAQAFLIDSNSGWHFQDLGDFNGDGKSDVLLMNSITNGIYVCEMDGTQLATNGLSFNVAAAAGWHFQDLADFNGDGKTDILLSNDVTHGLYVCEMNGTQLAGNGLSLTVAASAGWHFQDLADFNGDGKTDILLMNDTTHGVYVCQMDGQQIGANGQAGILADGWHLADKGDFNGDGKADLLFFNDSTHGVTVWQMNGTQVEASAQVGTIAAGYHYMGEGDYNGDGKTDLVFQNDATRAVQLWQMNGTEILASSQIAVLADGWHMVM